jgi:hypothetical protein
MSPRLPVRRTQTGRHGDAHQVTIGEGRVARVPRLRPGSPDLADLSASRQVPFLLGGPGRLSEL